MKDNRPSIGRPPKKEVDYKILKKKIWKGKVAQPGTLFIQIQVRKGNKRHDNTIQVSGGKTDEEINEIAENLREQLFREKGV